MLDIKQIEKRTCDVCGETLIHENNFEKYNYDWISLGIGYGPDGYHRIDICPSCKRKVLNYLKENCNDASSWPDTL